MHRLDFDSSPALFWIWEGIGIFGSASNGINDVEYIVQMEYENTFAIKMISIIQLFVCLTSSLIQSDG